MISTKVKGLALKIYDANMADEDRSDYWDKMMNSCYFNNPGLFLRIILNASIYFFVKQYLPSEGLFLDGGCGSNYFANLFDSDKRKIIGLDFAVDNLVKGKEVYPDAWSVAGDLNNLPFSDNTFDGVLSISTAEHLEDGPAKLFQETHRVLMAGGNFLLMIPTYNTEDVLCHMVNTIKNRFKKSLREIPHFQEAKLYKSVKSLQREDTRGFFAYWLSYKDIRRMLIECGFIIEKSFPLDVMSGMVRSRLFGKYAKNFLKETFPLLLKESSSEKRSWITKMFLQEDIYHNHLEFFLHEIAGFFYRYSFAFICKKPTIS